MRRCLNSGSLLAVGALHQDLIAKKLRAKVPETGILSQMCIKVMLKHDKTKR
jgi:hypothetical protein